MFPAFLVPSMGLASHSRCWYVSAVVVFFVEPQAKSHKAVKNNYIEVHGVRELQVPREPAQELTLRRSRRRRTARASRRASHSGVDCAGLWQKHEVLQGCPWPHYLSYSVRSLLMR
jgi:hypothetical protein